MELIKIYTGSLVNARELHQFLVVEAKGGQKGEMFANWIKRMLAYDFKLGQDYTTIGYNYKGDLVEENGVAKFSKSDNQKVSKREYFLTLDCSKQIAMIQNNDKGREARKYFIQCEEALQALKHNKRFEAFLKLETTKEKLRQNIEDIGGTNNDYIQIDLSGRKVLFNGNPIEDTELPIITLKGRDFAIALTNEALKEGEHTIEYVEELHKHHHEGVRNMIIENIKKSPEELPPEEKIKKLEE